MGLRSYNILEDATVAPSAGTVTAGYAACATSPMLGYVVATTANRASLSGATLAGVFLGSGVSGSFAPIVSSGHVDSSYVGTLSGSGDYVNVTSTGALQRSSTATADTIGIYEPDGGVWVDLSIQIGGAVTGNATAIQGVTVSSASAQKSWILAGDGTNIRSRKGQKNALDYGAVGDGTTDDTAALQAFLDDLTGGEDAFFPKVAAGYKITAPLKHWCGTQFRGSDAHANRLVFEGSGASLGTLGDCARILVAFGDFTGSAEIDYVGSGSGSATFTANASTEEITFASGIAGQYAQVRFTTTGTLPVGYSLATDYWLIEVSEGVCKAATSLANAIAGTAQPISDAGTGTHTLTVQSVGGTARQMMRLKNPTGITPSTDCVGLPIRTWNATDNDNTQQSTVCKVKQIGADVFMWVFNNQAGATAPDYGIGGSAGNGKVRFRIERSALDLRGREVKVEGGVFGFASSFRIGSMIRVTESPAPAAAGSTATTTTLNTIDKVSFICATQTQGYRAGIRICDDIIPTSDSSLSRFLVNGDGVPVPYSPFQVDYTRITDCAFIAQFYGTKANGILGFSRAAQSERNVVRNCLLSGLWNGITVPQTTLGGSNQAHFDIYDCELGHCWDSVLDISSQAFDLTISRCKGEFGNGRLLNDRSGASSRVVRVEGCEWFPFSAQATSTFKNNGHPTRRFIETNSAGVLYLMGNSIALGGDNSKWRIAHSNHNNGAGGSILSVVAIGNRVQGTSDLQGCPGFVAARSRGPYVFAGTETLDVKIDGGATTTVTFSQANFNTMTTALAGAAYVVDLNEVRANEVANLIMYFVGRDKCQALGSEDDTLLRIYSNDTAGSSVQVTGGTANTQLDFNAGIGSRSAKYQVTTDTRGLIEPSVNSSSDEMEVIHLGNAYYDWAAINRSVSDSFIKVYSGTAAASVLPATRLESVRGLSRPGSAVPPRNFWKAITHAGGSGATFTWTFDTAEDDTNYTVFATPVSETGAPAAGARTVTAITKNTGSAVFTATDPGGAATVTWHVELRR